MERSRPALIKSGSKESSESSRAWETNLPQDGADKRPVPNPFQESTSLEVSARCVLCLGSRIGSDPIDGKVKVEEVKLDSEDGSCHVIPTSHRPNAAPTRGSPVKRLGSHSLRALFVHCSLRAASLVEGRWEIFSFPLLSSTYALFASTTCHN